MTQRNLRTSPQVCSLQDTNRPWMHSWSSEYSIHIMILSITSSHVVVRSAMDTSVGQCPPRAQVAQADRIPLRSYSQVGTVLRPCCGAEGRQGSPGCLVWVWSHQRHAFSWGVWWQTSGTLLWDQDMG
jgi:hypothetical protein